jgi:hypothetical protein
LRLNLAFDNRNKGFDHNNNSGGFVLLHNTAYNNDRNFVFPYTVPGQQAVFVNNLAFAPVSSTNVQLPPNAVEAGNSWQLEQEVTEEMFVSLNTEEAKAPRQPDGSLPDIDLLKPAPGSVPVDAGVLAGHLFAGEAPDIGALEIDVGEWTTPWAELGSGRVISRLRVFDLDHAEEWTLTDTLEVGQEVFGTYTLTGVSGNPVMEDVIIPALEARTLNYLLEPMWIELVEPRSIMVAHADAIEPKPDWLLEDFVPTGASLTLTDASGVDHTMTLYVHVMQTDDLFSLGRNSTDGDANVPMYLVMVGDLITTGIEDERPVADAFMLAPMYPNPVTDAATISYDLNSPATVSLRVYDALGREATRLEDGFRTAGRHVATWDARSLPAGVYLVRLTADGASSVRRAVVVR